MATSDSPESNLSSPVISVSTADVEAAEVPRGTTPGSAAGAGSPHVGASTTPAPGTTDPETGETEVWADRYAFGNFAARFLIGFALIGVCLYFVYETSKPEHRGFYPLAVLSGAASAVYWVWVAFNIFRSRFSHRYRLTSKRLFVSSGVFRRQEDMMELEHLKEVTVQQQGMFDHLCKVGHVVVESNVKGAPTLILVGVNNPHKVSDLIYQNARA